jgi:putative spermidine/putrescine transport system permease protein
MQATRRKHRERRPASFYWLALLFGLFVLFLYGPVITIFILSFQGPEGGLTFPMRGVSLHWFAVLRQGVGDIDIWGAFARSVRLALAVTVLTVLFSVAAGLAFRKRFRGDTAVFYVSVASLIMPSIIVSLGIGLTFRLLDSGVKYLATAWGNQSFAART